MDATAHELIRALQQDIDRWEEEAKFWEDSRVIGMEDINGSKKSGKELAANCRARAEEWRHLIELISR